jgi:hypothetical protein
MTGRLDEIVAGETIGDLCSAIRGLKMTPQPDGMVHAAGTVGAPVIRALMRLEGLLLVEDADELARTPHMELRTPGQRRHDAFLRLGREIARVAGIDLPA